MDKHKFSDKVLLETLLKAKMFLKLFSGYSSLASGASRAEGSLRIQDVREVRRRQCLRIPGSPGAKIVLNSLILMKKSS